MAEIVIYGITEEDEGILIGPIEKIVKKWTSVTGFLIKRICFLANEMFSRKKVILRIDEGDWYKLNCREVMTSNLMLIGGVSDLVGMGKRKINFMPKNHNSQSVPEKFSNLTIEFEEEKARKI